MNISEANPLNRLVIPYGGYRTIVADRRESELTCLLAKILEIAMSAIEELKEYLNEGETVEGIVFGAWGWGSAPQEGEDWDVGYFEPDNIPVPYDMRGKVLTLEQAEPYMTGWNFFGGCGAPNCYATYVWTTQRVIWVTQYNGETELDSAPRNPLAMMPDMPGG